MADRNELEIALKTIGWRIHNSGNGLNDWIINAEDKRTVFKMRGDIIDLCMGGVVFGSAHSGILEFNLKYCDVEVSEDKEGVYLNEHDHDKKRRHPFMLHFYNFK